MGIGEEVRQLDSSLLIRQMGYRYVQFDRLVQEASTSRLAEATSATDYRYDLVGQPRVARPPAA